MNDPLPELPCACASIRRAARLVTQLYSREMAPELEPAPFSLLSMLSRRPGAGQTALGRDLGLDKTTLSRNLRLLQRNGWIEPEATGDRRARSYRLTPEGRRILAAARPAWLRAQTKLRDVFEPEDWARIMEAIGRVAEAARRA